MKKIIMVIIALLIVCGVFVGCGNKAESTKQNTTSKTQEKKPTSIDGILKENFKDSKINIDKKTKCITVTYQMEDNLTQNLMVENNLIKIKSALKELKSNKDFLNFDYITFDSNGTFTDKYGKDSTELVTEHNFNISEIKKVVNFDNIDNTQLIALQDGNTMINPAFKKDLSEDTINLLQPN